MTVTLNLPNELGERIRQEAERRDQTMDEYLVEVVSRSIAPSSRIARSLEILDSLDLIGDAQDHRETFEVLSKGEEQGGLSVRRRLA